MKESLEKLAALERLAEVGGGEDRLRRQHEAGKLTARERMLALFDPDRLGQALTLGAMAVAAGVVEGVPVTAEVTLVQMSSQGSGAAGGNGCQGAALLG